MHLHHLSRLELHAPVDDLHLHNCVHIHVTGSSEPPQGRRRAPHVAMENDRSPLLTERQRALLATLPAECFVLPGGRRATERPILHRCGVLDLYSGKAAVAKSLARRFNIWVVTVDFEHGSDQDLLDQNLQERLKELLEAGCFIGLGRALNAQVFLELFIPWCALL